MRYPRYIIATLTALALHGVALTYAKPETTLSMDTLVGQSSMQIQFVSAPKPSTTPTETASEEPKSPLAAENIEPVQPISEPVTENKPKVVESNQPTLPKSAPLPKSQPKQNEPGVSKPVPKKAPVEPIKPEAKSKPAIEKVDKKPTSSPQQTDVKEPVKTVAEKKPEPMKTEATPSSQTAAVTETEPKLEPDDQTDEALETLSTVTSSAKSAQPKLIAKPTFSAKPTPVSYPRLARNRGWQGRTVVEVWIDDQGKQVKTAVHQSSGHASLDKSALAAIKKWKFAKHNEHGRSVAHRVHIPIDFKLN
jgi:protein TonB